VNTADEPDTVGVTTDPFNTKPKETAFAPPVQLRVNPLFTGALDDSLSMVGGPLVVTGNPTDAVEPLAFVAVTTTL
jgi:hypothetical protein